VKNVIILVDVDVKAKHPNTLYFKYVKTKDYSGQKYTLIYEGANVRSDDLYLDENDEEIIKEQLNKLYGYGPFVKSKIKKIFEESAKQIFW